MSDPLSEIPRPPRPLTWRERVREWAEAIDLTPGRLVGGAVVLFVLGMVGWKLLEPPDPPPEMRLPMVSSSVPPDPGGGVGRGGSGPGGRTSMAATPASTSTPVEVVVHVAGAVASPGVQHLPAGTRVVDAVEAAGGAAPDADLGRINLAATLQDGQQVYVPRSGEPIPPSVAGELGPAQSRGPLDLNEATAEDLDKLPGIGPSIAQAIVDHRTRHGRFTTIDQLLDVRGIGQAKLDELRDLVVV